MRPSLPRVAVVRHWPVLLAFAGLVGGLPGCKHEPLLAPLVDEDGGGVVVDCDPQVVYFQQQVLPILISNCAVPGCHDEPTNDNDGIQLTSFSSLMASGIVQNGDLVEAINETDPDKVMPPPGQAGLSQQQIDLIELWLAQGAQNNSCTGLCDTTAVVTYSGAILPLVQQRCAGCHGGSNPQGGLNFSTHAVLASVALDGRLEASVTRAPNGIPMPPWGPQLSQCEIDKFVTWIQAGAPNN